MKGHCVWLVWRPCTAATIAPLFSRTIQSDRSTATLCTKMILSLANGAHLYSCVLRRFARVLTESFVYLNQAVVYRSAGALRISQESGISTFDRQLYHLLATTRAPCAPVFQAKLARWSTAPLSTMDVVVVWRPHYYRISQLSSWCSCPQDDGMQTIYFPLCPLVAVVVHGVSVLPISVTVA